MVAYTYSRVAALNFNTTPPGVAKSATGSVYAVADTTFTTPLNMTMVVGGSVVTTISSDAQGFFPDFTVNDRTSVVWKQASSSFTTVLTTSDPVPGPQGAAGTPGATGAQGPRGDLATWQTATFYPLNQVIANPSGDLVKVTTAHTSGASYDATKFGWVNNNAANLTGLLPEASVPTRLTATELNATFVPKWKATTAYLAGDKVLSPAGDVVSAKVGFTSGASYNAADWDLSATVTGKLDVTTAASTYAKVNPARLAPGARWGFLGDSITNGSTASNFAYSYAPQAVQMVGGMVARPDSIEAGVPGERSDQALTRLPALLTAGSEAVVVLLGANDAEQAVTLATFKANMIAIIQQAKAGGCPVVLCTVPPRAASVAAATRSRIDGYNDWIRTATVAYGAELADVYSVLADTTTGGMLAAYDSGDNIHPNDLGHQKMGVEVAKAMKRCVARTGPYGLVRTVSPANLITDPLVVGGTVRPAGWFEQPGGTGTAPTYSLVSDTSGVLPAGRWSQMDFDATASGGTRTLASNSITAFATGDVLLYAAHIQIEDVTGTWAADVAAGTASIAAVIVNGATGVAMVSTPPLVRASGIPSATAGVYDIGPLVFPVTVPAGPTTLNLWFQFKLPTGKHAKLRVGGLGVINETTRGAQAEFNWAPIMVNM